MPSPHDQHEADFHKQIGAAIRAWANLERVLWEFIAAFLGVDQFRARIVFASMPNLRARRELIVRLGETYLDATLLPEFRRLMARLKSLASRRNMLAHDTFASREPGSHLIFFDKFSDEMDGGFDLGRVEMPGRDLADMVVAFKTLDRDLGSFLLGMSGRVHRETRRHRETG